MLSKAMETPYGSVCDARDRSAVNRVYGRHGKVPAGTPGDM